MNNDSFRPTIKFTASLIKRRKEMKLRFRNAQKCDVTRLVNLLADDALGIRREDVSKPINKKYYDAFYKIDQDPNNELVVVERCDHLVGMLQLTFIPYLTHIGSWRCIIEGVRIDRDSRGQGLGKKLINWAITRAIERNCNIVQLTSDKQRIEALRFYESLGFKATHEGYKLKL
jgi:ribosomal protein S18 acetylase RimI-like enzyme